MFKFNPILQDSSLWFLSGLLVFIGIFLLLREFWCWYWKINERVNLLRKIEENTRKEVKENK